MAVDFVLAGTTTYNVTGTVTKLEGLGPGGNGYWGTADGLGGPGGGGGVYGVKNNPANLSPGNHTCRVGAGGSQVSTALQNDSAMWLFGVDFGANAAAGAIGTGGLIANCLGLDSGNDGGDGGNGGGQGLGGGGGGGAGGPNGPGADGATASASSGHGAGGGGADNGNAGTAGDASNAGQGGISGLASSTPGAGATAGAAPTNGSLGAGAGGGFAFGTYINGANGNSGGNQFDGSHGCGGGGGGGGINGEDMRGGNGGDGGAYGGGGGGGGASGADYGGGGGGSYGLGADGLLIITYGGAATPTLKLASIVIDNGLAELHTYGTTIYLCTQEPTDYTQASSTYAKGHATIAFGSPTNDTLGDGRKVVSGAISSGTIDGTGDVTHWAVVDPSGGGRLLATGNFENPVSVESGQGFTLEALHLALPWG